MQSLFEQPIQEAINKSTHQTVHSPSIDQTTDRLVRVGWEKRPGGANEEQRSEVQTHGIWNHLVFRLESKERKIYLTWRVYLPSISSLIRIDLTAVSWYYTSSSTIN